MMPVKVDRRQPPKKGTKRLASGTYLLPRVRFMLPRSAHRFIESVTVTVNFLKRTRGPRVPIPLSSAKPSSPACAGLATVCRVFQQKQVERGARG